MKALRILRRSVRDSFKSIFRNLPLSMASIICITITLILVSLSLFLSYNVRQITKTLEHELTVVVYLKKDVTENQKKEIENDLKTMDNIDEYRIKSKEEFKSEMQKESEDLATAFESLEGDNPLLDSIIVKVKDVSDLKETAEKLRKYDFVQSAEYGEGMVENIIGIFDAISIGTAGIVIALVVVTSFLISNTIKITIFSRKTQIEIKRLVGASNVAIKLPFVFEGFILGIFGSILPILLSIYGYTILYNETHGYLFTRIITLVPPFPFVFIVSFILVAIGSIVGMIGSWLSVRKHLKI